MRSQPNIEVAIGNLKLSQAKSQLGKSKLQPLCYSRTPKGGHDQSLRSRPEYTLSSNIQVAVMFKATETTCN